MNDVTKDLLEALRDLIDNHWLEDSHAVGFDGTVMFGPYYDFSGIDGCRRSEFRDDGIEFVVWPAGGAGRKWSAYSTYEGSLWFEQFDSEAKARAVCMKRLADVMPEHAVSKAMVAIARAEAALAAPQPDADGWINPNDKTQKRYLPHIGEKVLFCYDGVTYYGKHTGGSFQSFNPPRRLCTWGCLWMYPPKAREAQP